MVREVGRISGSIGWGIRDGAHESRPYGCSLMRDGTGRSRSFVDCWSGSVYPCVFGA